MCVTELLLHCLRCDEALQIVLSMCSSNATVLSDWAAACSMAIRLLGVHRQQQKWCRRGKLRIAGEQRWWVEKNWQALSLEVALMRYIKWISSGISWWLCHKTQVVTRFSCLQLASSTKVFVLVQGSEQVAMLKMLLNAQTYDSACSGKNRRWPLLKCAKPKYLYGKSLKEVNVSSSPCSLARRGLITTLFISQAWKYCYKSGRNLPALQWREMLKLKLFCLHTRDIDRKNLTVEICGWSGWNAVESISTAISTATVDFNRISTASTVILCFMPAGNQDHHVMWHIIRTFTHLHIMEVAAFSRSTYFCPLLS